MSKEPGSQLKTNVVIVGLAVVAAIGWLRPTSQIGRYQIIGISHEKGYGVVKLDTTSGEISKETTSYGAMGENRGVLPKRVNAARSKTKIQGELKKANSTEILAK